MCQRARVDDGGGVCSYPGSHCCSIQFFSSAAQPTHHPATHHHRAATQGKQQPSEANTRAHTLHTAQLFASRVLIKTERTLLYHTYCINRVEFTYRFAAVERPPSPRVFRVVGGRLDKKKRKKTISCLAPRHLSVAHGKKERERDGDEGARRVAGLPY